MSLSLAAVPGFTELPDSDFNAGATASDANMKALNAAAKFGVVRGEQFWGYYRHGETVELPTSAADGYVYARSELYYIAIPYWSGSATAALNGTQSPPARGATTGPGTLLQFGYDVNQANGNVTCLASYYKTSQTDTNDGILMVMTLALRQR